jgi:FMN phosphatase YigB (HAD superfamily)
MSLTVLFDLDDTLISNNVDTFIPGYLKTLGATIDGLASKQAIQHLLAATQKMSESSLPDKTLEQIFDENFYPNIGVSKQQLRGTIDHFYADVYPDLEKMTRPIPAAVQLVDRLFDEGYTVAIATRPLFPRTAIVQRLAWAGLSIERYPFAIVPSYEIFHFSKPNPAFYAELLAQIGWPNQPAVMVGNALEDDILPASQFDIPAFWLNDPVVPLPDNAHPLTGQGKIDEVYPWIKKIESAKFEQTWSTPASILEILKSTPAALQTICSRIPADKWSDRPQPDEWALTEILCYLRDLDREIITPRLYRVIEENNPFMPRVSSSNWVEKRPYLEESGFSVLENFTKNRIELLNFIFGLPDKSWYRQAVEEDTGPTTFKKLLGSLAAHDQNLIRTAVRTIKSIELDSSS